ncbi:GNAT family N-acetyltransferase [Campylobacter peloridis]|uniref:GNAT family N-acetyltransferase n=1 Tax=Campylobacter peloridis TaxID=488546 RepID=UPI001C72F089|nr:GNAT family N-acetyltransferase [Campylobacter peloridis]MBX1886509.1 GNAT family N-acetyltransferase [Campylobacter peloridis]MBX2078006.1 GNAT family N-acetyltransferase [Campylobacter peloridis]
MRLIVKKFIELDTKEVYKICKLRQDVFIVEQRCIYGDLDDKDLQCLHVFYEDNANEIISYCRIVPKGINFDTISIGRIIVNQKYRNQGIAKKLLLEVFEIIKNNYKEFKVKISAQNRLKGFYKSLGFEEISDVYDEDGILHINMLVDLKNANNFHNS